MHGESQTHDVVDPVGMKLGERERRGAAHGQPDEMGAGDLERIEQGQRIGDELRVGVAARRRLGRAVAALVVAQHAERRLEVRHLEVPHGDIGGERIAEHDPGRAFRPIDLAVEGDAVRLDPHGLTPSLLQE